MRFQTLTLSRGEGPKPMLCSGPQDIPLPVKKDQSSETINQSWILRGLWQNEQKKQHTKPLIG